MSEEAMPEGARRTKPKLWAALVYAFDVAIFMMAVHAGYRAFYGQEQSLFGSDPQFASFILGASLVMFWRRVFRPIAKWANDTE